ncbi:MAG: gliding motility-associated C-terminal domain-containing protein [Bacteroidia bacterium]|nr:gliding motility-associated C-terminal domain-containing protein [Bacteroidia bacterium]
MNIKWFNKKYSGFIKLSVLTLLSLWGFKSDINGQVIKSFVQRPSAATPTKLIYSIRGDYTMIGNTNLTLQSYDNTTNNSNNVMKYVDVDGDPNTLNSSSATLGFSTENGAIPSCSNIIYAGLYWTGRASDASTSPESFSVTKGSVTKNYNKRTISLKGPGQTSYTQLVANAGNIYYPDGIYGNMYSAYIEVTSYVKANGIGQYTVADMALIEGNGNATGYYGGWGMIVVYENSKMNWRDVTIFDGHAYVVGNATVNFELPVSGFNTVQAGPVNLKLGLMAGEGDVGIPGDYFKIRNWQNTAWVDLNHSGNTITNFFNGSVNTGGNVRNPSLQNNTGLDIAMFNIPNPGNTVVTNNQTSTRFQYGSTQDTYVIFCIAMAVDAYVPDVELLVSTEYINGVPVGTGPLTVLPGQDIEYKLQVRNLGTEAINNTKFIVPIPYTTTYVANSALTVINFTPLPTPNNVYYDANLGLTGSIVWDFGTLPMPPVGYPDSVLAELTFHFRVTTDCNILKNPDCPPTVTLSGGVSSGTGAISGTSFSNRPFIQGYKKSGVCIGEPITDPLQISIDGAAYIAANCQSTPANRSFVFCNYTQPTIPLTSIAPGFPGGLRFFNTNNITPTSIEYDSNNPFPATPGTHTYFAIPFGVSLCYYTFTISVSNLTTLPTAANVVYCLNETAQPLTATASNPSYVLNYYTSLTSTTPLTSITPSTSVAGVTTYYVAEAEPASLGGCVSSNRLPVTVTVYNSSVSVASQANVLCKGANTGTAAITATGGSGNYSYAWSTSPAQTGATATGLSAGIYTVTVTDNNGCTVPKTATVTITEPSLVLSAGVATQTNVFCKGSNTGTATASASGGSGSYSYIWSTIPPQTTPVATALSASTYTVTVKDNNGCAVFKTAVVTIAEPGLVLSAGVTSQANVLCKGANTGTATAAATGGSGVYSYAWSTMPVQTTASATGLSAGLYVVTVTDNNGCTVPKTASVTITEPSLVLGVAVISEANVLCKGENTGTATAAATGGSGGYAYTWSTVPLQTAASATGLPAGNYTVTVNDNNGCTVPKTATAAITEPVLVLSAGIVSQTNVFCKGSKTGTASVSGIGGSGSYLYSWSTAPVQTTSSATGLSAGIYTVTVSDNNGCTVPKTTTVTITEPALILGAGIASQANVLCKGDNTGTALVSATGGSGNYSYAWSTVPVQTTVVATGLSAGMYAVTVTDNNGCTVPKTATVTITEPAYVLNANITSQSNVLCKGGSTGAATVTAVGGSGTYSYVWSSVPVQLTASATGLSAGIYSVTVTDNNGCTIPKTAVVTITEPLLVLSAGITSQSNVLCKGGNSGTAFVSAAGGSGSYSYLWSTSPVQTNASAIGLSAGVYTVTVSDNNGCAVPVTASITITEPVQVLAAGITSQTNVLCKGYSTGSATVTATGGSGSYIYVWSTNPANGTATVSGLSAGSYIVTVTDNNGCGLVAIAVAVITEPSEGISVAINTLTQANVLCNGGNTGSTTAVANGGSGTYSYTWSTLPVQTTSTAVGLSVGTYTVTVSDVNGCAVVTTSAAIITEPAALDVKSSSTHTICDKKSGAINVTVTGGTPLYTYSWSNGSVEEDVSGLDSGTYTVEVSDANGCKISDTVIVTQTYLTITLSSPTYTGGHNLSGYQSGDGSIDLTVSGLQGPFIYKWSNGANTEDLSHLPAGSYFVVVTDREGCSAVGRIELSEPMIFEMPTGFSPNSDGKNDFFVVHGLEISLNNQLTVFNRWGNIVYQSGPYLNNWDGVSLNGELLPDGTYFAVLEISDKKITLKGYVDIRR